MNLLDFVFIDCFETIKTIYAYLFGLYYTIFYYKSPLIVTQAYVKCLENGLTKDISNEISNGSLWKFKSKNYNVYIYYKHLPSHKDYALVYNNSKVINFPPYDYSTYNKRVRPGIISMCINNEDMTNLLTTFAGPKQNFYTDLHDTKLSWITQDTYYDTLPVIQKSNAYGERKTVDPLTMKEV